MIRVRRLLALGALLALTACGGGDGNNTVPLPNTTTTTTTTTTGTGTTTPTPVNNSVTVTVDQGPSTLDTGTNGYLQYDTAYVSVTICAPGSATNCQTIDHVQIDTGSVGLRILQSVIAPGLLSALPTQTDGNGNPVGECYGYVDGYVFGSVRSADFSIGGETVAGMPFQVVGDTGVFGAVPFTCSSGGGPNENTVQALGSNGILGIGVTPTDCGAICQTAGGYAAAAYYDCPSSGCNTIIARSSSTSAPFQQLPNPVAAFATDNNGSILVLPSVAAAGQSTLTGTLYFGIGTQSNNALGSAKVLTVTPSSSRYGPGLLTVTYKGETLNDSFIDSGSNSYFFVDSTIAACQDTNYTGYYCPSSSLELSLGLQGANNASTVISLTLQNAATLLNTTSSALPGIGANPDSLANFNAYPDSFDLGLPFFFGRSVYTAIEGRSAGGVQGPYVAF